MIMKNSLLASSLLLLSLVSPIGMAQPAQLTDIQRDLALFSGILEEALGLNESTGLFGRSLGGVSSTYLMNQGVVFEVRSPLANRRNRMGLASLSSAMQALQLQENPFLAMRRTQPATVAETSALAVDEASTGGLYQQLRDQIANIDFSLVVNTAIQQATHSARALRALGSVDESGYESLFAEIEQLRGQIEANTSELRALEAELRSRQAATEESAATAAEDSLQQRFDELLQRLEPIKQEALTLAADLKERSSRAEAEYAEQWQRDLLAFERTLYVTLCDYGDSLARIPDQESLSFILQGLGDDGEDSRRTDKVHIIKMADVSTCAAQSIESEALQSRATSYTY